MYKQKKKNNLHFKRAVHDLAIQEAICPLRRVFEDENVRRLKTNPIAVYKAKDQCSVLPIIHCKVQPDKEVTTR
jgi:hypothetical protein